MNGEGSNQQTLNVPNRDANKGETSMSIGDKKVGVTPLCFKCGGYSHYVVVCLSKGLLFCVEEEPKFELKSYPKEEETCNEDQLSDECDY